MDPSLQTQIPERPIVPGTRQHEDERNVVETMWRSGGSLTPIRDKKFVSEGESERREESTHLDTLRWQPPRSQLGLELLDAQRLCLCLGGNHCVDRS